MFAVEPDRAAAFALFEHELVILVDEIRRRLVEAALAHDTAVQGSVGALPPHAQHLVATRVFDTPAVEGGADSLFDIGEIDGPWQDG